MTRISENQIARQVLNDIIDNRLQVNKYGQEISSGLKASEPGDSRFSGTINQYRELINRLDGHGQRIAAVQSLLAFQDNVATQLNDLVVRGQELATQMANETNDSEARAQAAKEVWEIRSNLITLANSKYQGRYIYGGLDDDDPPYDLVTNYDEPTSGDASLRYQYDDISAGTGEPGGALTRSVSVSDDLSIEVNTPGSEIFDNALYALERLGRALEGYATNPATGQPDGTGSAYTFPDEIGLQTDAIQGAIDDLNASRTNDILPERVTLGARLRRLETAQGVIEVGRTDAQTALASLQNADVAESATNLTQAQSALQASLTVSTRVLRLSVLDFL